MSTIDLQKFMELRESARVRQQEQTTRKGTSASASDWKALLESKRQELGVSSNSSNTATSSARAAVSTTATTATSATARSARTTAADISGSLEDKVDELRDRKSQGLSVRELGNFIDVRA